MQTAGSREADTHPVDWNAAHQALRSARAPRDAMREPWLLPSGISVDRSQLRPEEQALARPNRPVANAARVLAARTHGAPEAKALHAEVTCPITHDVMEVPAWVAALRQGPAVQDDTRCDFAALRAWVRQSGRTPRGDRLSQSIEVRADVALGRLARACQPDAGVGASRPAAWRYTPGVIPSEWSVVWRDVALDLLCCAATVAVIVGLTSAIVASHQRPFPAYVPPHVAPCSMQGFDFAAALDHGGTVAAEALRLLQAARAACED